MMMWADRLIDRKTIDYGNEYECSDNGTGSAVDHIPTDVILCDWHYEVRDTYPSTAYFQQKGFRVLPSTWHGANATRRFMDYARETATDRMIGHLFTTWVGAQDMCPALLGEGDSASLPAEAVKAAETLRNGVQWLKNPNGPQP